MRAIDTIFFTDLDGTLLDHDSYSWAAAEEALHELERRRLPLVFVTSKTRAEVEVLRRKMGNSHPFVTENGGGIFYPRGYFPQKVADSAPAGHQNMCIALARPYVEITQALDEVAEEAGVTVVGFHHMSAREVAQNTGLSPREAELARQREFDEPFFFAGSDEQQRRFVALAKQRGLSVERGGRFWHLFAGSDKGRAVQRLMRLYRDALRGSARLRSVALGDSANDLPMLEAAGTAIVLPAPGGKHDEAMLKRLPRAVRASAPGPAGWNQAVLDLLRS
ncbi:MAG: HAD-IIB family hydrolase [Candidatus Acidiferrales bacterium]